MGVSLPTFLNIAAANLDTFLAALIPQREGSGKLFGSDSTHDPFPHRLKAVLVQSDVYQLPFTCRNKKKSNGARSQIGRVEENLDAVGSLK
jgi:hypothetical protein